MPVFDNLSLISILLMAVQFFIVVSVVIRVILTRHPPGSSFSWSLLTVVLPYVGFFLYLMLGERPIGRLRARLLRHATHYWGRPDAAEYPCGYWLMTLALETFCARMLDETLKLLALRLLLPCR